MKKPSKGIIVYLFTMLIGWALNVTRLWNKFFEIILKVGIKDNQSVRYIEEIFIRTQICSARWIGVIVGGIIALVIIVGVFKLKPWARKLLLFFSSLGIIIYGINMPRLLSFYKNIATEGLWSGYYLFAFLIILGIGYLISILIFFTKGNIKKQFT